MNQKLSSLSVFFPCYNEAANLPALIQEAAKYVPKIASRYEIIVVNDGSSDSTSTVVTQLQKEYPFVRMVNHTTNLGYGASLKTGIREAKYEWVFWTDGDLQFNLESLESFLPFTKKYDAIIGFRAHRADSFIRKLNGELYTQLINLLFGMNVRDIDCAFKLIKASRLSTFPITSSSAFTSAEILIRLHQSKTPLHQVSVAHFPRKKGTPTGGSIKVIFAGLKQTLFFFLQTQFKTPDRTGSLEVRK